MKMRRLEDFANVTTLPGLVVFLFIFILVIVCLKLLSVGHIWHGIVRLLVSNLLKKKRIEATAV
jgi:hypothetical protein